MTYTCKDISHKYSFNGILIGDKQFVHRCVILLKGKRLDNDPGRRDWSTYGDIQVPDSDPYYIRYKVLCFCVCQSSMPEIS